MLKPLKELLDFSAPEINSTNSRSSWRKRRDSSHWRKKNSTNGSFNFLALIHQWPEIVGNRLSKHTMPLKLNRHNLVILTSHATYSTQLSFLSEKLKEKIIQYFPELGNKVHTISYQCNQQLFLKKDKGIVRNKDHSKKPNILHPLSPEYRQYKKQAETVFQNIADLEMREYLISIYIQNAASSNS